MSVEDALAGERARILGLAEGARPGAAELRDALAVVVDLLGRLAGDEEMPLPVSVVAQHLRYRISARLSAAAALTELGLCDRADRLVAEAAAIACTPTPRIAPDPCGDGFGRPGDAPERFG